MSARSGGRSRPGPGSRAKSGKPRPGTGGQGKRRLEGKGPTPPAELRPGHPAQRRAGRVDRAARAARTDARPYGAAGSGARASRGDGARAGARPATAAAEVVAGRNPVLEALRAAVPSVALHVGPRLDADERISEAITLAADAGIPVVEAGRSELDRITAGAVHQGLALRVRRYSYAHPEDLPERARRAGQQPLVIALDGITDPRNLGAVARSAAALGGHGVLVPARRAAGVSAGAWKASAGALARIPVAQATSLASALAGYQRQGMFVIGLDAAGDVSIAETGLADGPVVVVVGSEGRGLSRLVSQRCDVLARIPITAAAESLNAGVAAGIALYEIAGQRAAGARQAGSGVPSSTG